MERFSTTIDRSFDLPSRRLERRRRLNTGSRLANSTLILQPRNLKNSTERSMSKLSNQHTKVILVAQGSCSPTQLEARVILPLTTLVDLVNSSRSIRVLGGYQLKQSDRSEKCKCPGKRTVEGLNPSAGTQMSKVVIRAKLVRLPNRQLLLKMHKFEQYGSGLTCWND